MQLRLIILEMLKFNAMKESPSTYSGLIHLGHLLWIITGSRNIWKGVFSWAEKAYEILFKKHDGNILFG